MNKLSCCVLLCLLLLTTACNQQPQPMKQQNVQDATRRMAGNESVQRSFSDGRIQVMTDDGKAKQALLKNTLKEQQMIASDPDLRRRQLQLQNRTRDEALQNGDLRALLLKQNLQEQQAALRDPGLQNELLQQYIQAFRIISSTPSLRTEMADALIPLLKDPKIAKEMEKMMKLMMAKEMKKMQAMMQMMQQKQAQQMMQMQQQMKQQMQQKKQKQQLQQPQQLTQQRPAH